MSSPVRRLLIDITHAASHDYNTGIQRVVRSLAREALAYSKDPSTTVECFPVVLLNGEFVHLDQRCAARGFQTSSSDWPTYWQSLIPDSVGPSTRLRLNRIGTRIRKLLYPRTLFRKARLLAESVRPEPVPVNPGPGDVILMPDSWWDLPEMFKAIESVRQNGALVGALVHDLIPIRFPEFFEDELQAKFCQWAKRLVNSVDFFLGTAQATEEDLWRYIREENPSVPRSHVGHVRLGCDIKTSTHFRSFRVPTEIRRIFADQKSAPYLMVSTVEVRKNHHYLLDAFDQLWKSGQDVSLVLVGRVGWKCDTVVERISQHPEAGKRLHMFTNVNDDSLNFIYEKSKAFLFPSKAEGFGLPIVEAQHRGLHVFASDIPIFREVAGSGAQFFSLDDPSQLRQQVLDFEASRGWESDPEITVVNEPWRLVFPKLVDVVGQLASNVHRERQQTTSTAA